MPALRNRTVLRRLAWSCFVVLVALALVIGGYLTGTSHTASATEAAATTSAAANTPPGHASTTNLVSGCRHGQAPPSGSRTITLDGSSLTTADIVDIASCRATVRVSSAGMSRIEAARSVVNRYIDDKIPAYGITTMYGADFKKTLPPSQIVRFGRINITQEATRVGDGNLPLVDDGTMRAAWALLVNSFARGYSGASPDLANLLVDRVNSGNVPDDVEYGNSMGDADLTANAQADMSLLADPSFRMKPGEATNLLTHNFISVALAAEVVERAKALLAAGETSLALSMEGFRANLGPLSQAESRQDALGSRRAVRDALRRLLAGSLLWKPNGPRQLQDFLSLRDGVENLATLRLAIDQYTPVLEAFANSNQGSPVVDVKGRTLTSVPDYDTTQVTLGMDTLRQALGLVVVASNSRGLKVLSHPFTDLPSGLSSPDPLKSDGIYTRNITYIMTSLERAALLQTQTIVPLTESYVAEGDEDYSPAFPNSVLMAENLAVHAGQVITLEGLIGSAAVQRRIALKQLTIDDVPPALRGLQRGIIKRSPFAIPITRQYDLGPLLAYYVGAADQAAAATG
jgi:histidine ammonia-lyase